MAQENNANENGLKAIFNEASVTIEGGLWVPTSGYSYSLTQAEQGKAGELHLNLTITSPRGAALQAFEKLTIEGEFATKASSVYVHVIKERFLDQPDAVYDDKSGKWIDVDKVEKEVDTLKFRKGKDTDFQQPKG